MRLCCGGGNELSVHAASHPTRAARLPISSRFALRPLVFFFSSFFLSFLPGPYYPPLSLSHTL